MKVGRQVNRGEATYEEEQVWGEDEECMLAMLNVLFILSVFPHVQVNICAVNI